ncbi:RING finger protein 212B-like [Penaeus monodon]|uniref:RING finger protein 212B-like n=1 Tax=Penaeus monodon TaxID=6687 RepID=UPI0018A7600C|nr:RING finger protein 212B-like [Penaeus monodon]
MPRDGLVRSRLILGKIEIYLYRIINVGIPFAMDWINCNSCCRQPGDEKERTFVLTSCGHIFCDVCLSQVESKEKCATCSTRCQLIQLSSKMKPDAEMFFLEPGELLKRQNNQINRLLEFQKEHRIRLVSFHRRIIQKYKDLEKEFRSASANLKEMEKKYVAASKHIQELEGENHKLREMVSGQGGTGSSATLGHFSSPHSSYQRAITTQRSSPHQAQVSPGGSRISPGRLTLVKTTPGCPGTSCSPTHQQNAPSAQYVQSGRPSHAGQFASSPQVHQALGLQQTQAQLMSSGGLMQTPTGSGMKYMKYPSPVQQCGTPPSSRGMLGSMGRLTPQPQGQHCHPPVGMKSGQQMAPHLHGHVGFQAQQRLQLDQRMAPHHSRLYSPHLAGSSPTEGFGKGGSGHLPFRHLV